MEFGGEVPISKADLVWGFVYFFMNDFEWK